MSRAWVDSLEAAFGEKVIRAKNGQSQALFELHHQTLYFAGRRRWLADYATLDGDPGELLQLLEMTIKPLRVRRVILDAIESKILNRLQGELKGWYSIQRFQAYAPELVLTTESVARIIKKDSFKRSYNKLERGKHVVQVEVFEDLPARLAVLDEFIAQHAFRSFEKRGESEFSDANYQAFYRELLKRDHLEANAECRVHFSALSINGKRLAFHLGFQTKERFYWYKPAFTSAKAVISAPGEYLMVQLIQKCFQNRISVFDFTLGDETYKARFANQTKELFEIRFYRSAVMAWLWSLRQKFKRHWARFASRK